MLVIIEGRTLGVVGKDYDIDGTKGTAYKLSLLQDDATVVEIKLDAKSASQLEQCRALKELDAVSIECTFYEASMRSGRRGEYLQKSSFAFTSIVPGRLRAKTAA
jgi:hypothetical protein